MNNLNKNSFSDKIDIVKMESKHFDSVLEMMRVFYNSPAVLHTSSKQVLENDIKACIGDNPFLDGYVFLYDKKIAGYSMVSKSFTTEYGGLCAWIEDLYVKEDFRKKNISKTFFKKLPSLYPDVVRFKLEVEPENTDAIQVYNKCDYKYLPYDIMENVIVSD